MLCLGWIAFRVHVDSSWEHFGIPLSWRRDGAFAYQLAVVVDDARGKVLATSCAVPTC